MTRIKELREKMGIEQKQLAVDLGVSQPTISDWENGRKTPSAKRTEKIADYFQVTIDYLLCRTDDAFSQDSRSVTGNDEEIDKELRELKAIWNQLDPQYRNEILKYAKYKKFEQSQ